MFSFIHVAMLGCSLHTVNHGRGSNKVYYQQLIMEMKLLFQKYCKFMHILQLLQMLLSWCVNN